MLNEHQMIAGIYDKEKINKTPESLWFYQVWADFRGELYVHPSAFLGFGTKIITTSHTLESGVVGRAVPKRVQIDEDVFVGSFSVLYNCWLKHHSIVACGAVVRNIIVEPYTVVEGNPAQPIKRWANGKWERI